MNFLKKILRYFDEFSEIDRLLWRTHIYLYATFGSIYCFYQNSKWIIATERKLNFIPAYSLQKTFWQILIFPVGIWFVQPKLNRISISI